jgi:hypothetical protein
MARMSSQTRQDIIETAKSKGFFVKLKSDGTDLYDKNLVFTSGTFSASPVYVSKETDISSVSGEINYLKVAVKPDAFVASLMNPAQGIEESINRQSKTNRQGVS